MKKRNYLLSLALTAILSLTCLAGCSKSTETASIPEVVKETASVEIVEGGVLCLKVNPEIAVHYDSNGLVTKVEARNEDAKAIINSITNYSGKETHEVVKELVTAIGNAGYFVEEVEGISKQITIEIEVGSKIPNDKFIDEVVTEVKNYVASNEWNSFIDLENNTDYGITDYGTAKTTVSNTTTAPATKPEPVATPALEPAPKSTSSSTPNTDYGITDYNDTDYGPNNDGVTDYGKTNYDDHVTDYGKTNYDDHVTDYGKTNYDDGKTDYGKDSGYDD